MKAIMKNKYLFVFLFFTNTLTNAQVQSRNFEIGMGLGTYIYQGDLTPNRIGSFKTMKPGLHLFANKIMSSSLSYRLNLAIAKLKGDESKYSNPEYRQQRNFQFKTPLVELSGLAVWDIRGNNFNREKKIFSPYLFTGGGLGLLKISRDWSRFNAEFFSTESAVTAGLNTDSQKKLPRILPFIPVGLGFRYEISNLLAVNTEATYRFIFSDYLDGFSYAANPERDDHYHSITIGVIYKFGNKNRLNCPPVK
jgi:Domain of unknown function (DUF6089)